MTAKVAKSHFGSQTESLKEKRRLMIATASLTCYYRHLNFAAQSTRLIPEAIVAKATL